MPVRFKVNENVVIDLPEMTEEALEKLLKDPIYSMFLPFDCPDIIRERFKEAQATGDWKEI